MRRRRQEQALNLFAFQDIITGVAGVMLFILLLLVVQLSLRSAIAVAAQKDNPPPESEQPAPEIVTTADPFPAMQKSLQEMKSELEQLRKENDVLLKASERDLEAETAAAKEELDELIRQAEERKKKAKEMEELAASQEVSEERREILEQREELESQLEELQKEQDRHASGKLIAFKLTSNQSKSTWVVDMHDWRAELFSVAAPEDTKHVTYDRTSPPSVIVSKIKTALAKHSKGRAIILILRPSVAGPGVEFLDAFRRGGFSVALELLDEDTIVTQSSGSGASP